MDNNAMNYNEAVVGYAYVPPQTEFVTYNPTEALENGTLFPQLNLSMCEYVRGVKGDTCND